MITIYGIFTKDGFCLYVGQTAKSVDRQLSHAKRFPEGIWKVLLVTTPEQAYHDEDRMIRAYWDKQEAPHNRVTQTKRGGTKLHRTEYLYGTKPKFTRRKREYMPYNRKVFMVTYEDGGTENTRFTLDIPLETLRAKWVGEWVGCRRIKSVDKAFHKV